MELEAAAASAAVREIRAANAEGWRVSEVWQRMEWVGAPPTAGRSSEQTEM